MTLKLVFKTIIILVILLNASSVIGQKTNDWKLARNQKGVRVYIRNHGESHLKEVLGIMEMRTSLSALVGLLKDTQNHNKWMYANKYSKFLKNNNEHEWVLYTESEAPWPVSNRDLISFAKMKQNSKNYIIEIEAEERPNYIPRKSGLVRIQKMNSIWVFKPKKKGIIEVKFEILIDLGGNLPVWVANMAIDKGPYYTLVNMSKMVQQDKYQKLKLSYIKEKPFE